MRSAAAREAILDATARLFHDEGYERLTIEGIAKAAGTGKQTIYRWWPSRGALIAECLMGGRLIPINLEVPNTGDVIEDVQTWLRTVFAIISESRGDLLLRSLVAAAAEDAAVGRQLGESLGVDSYLRARLHESVNSGQLAAEAPVDQLVHALLGAIIVESLGRKEGGLDGFNALTQYLLAPPSGGHSGVADLDRRTSRWGSTSDADVGPV